MRHGSDPEAAAGKKKKAPGMDSRFAAHLLAVSPVVIYSLKPDGKFATGFISDTVRKLTGHDPDDFLRDPSFGEKQIHPDDVELYRAAFREAARDGAAVMETRFRTRAGDYRWFRHELHLIRDDDGRAQEIVGSMVDVSREKRAEDERRRSEQRFNDYADIASDWLWEMDADLRVSYLSGRMVDRLGSTEADVLGKTRQEMAGEDVDTPSWRAYLDDLRHRRPFRDFEYVHRTQSGELRHVRVSGKPNFSPDGEFLGYRGTGSNVTAQRRAEEVLKLTQARVARAEQRLADAVESMSEGFILLDAERRFVMCNSRYREFYPAITHLLVSGTPFEEIIRHCALRGEIQIDGDLDVALAKRLGRRHFVGEELLATGRWLRVSDHRTKDGGIVGIRTDITALKEQEQALRRREQLLSEAQKIARMGHWRWDAGTRRMEWSDGLFRLMGTSPDEHRPDFDDFIARVHVDDREALARVFDECLETAASRQWEGRVRNVAGNDLTVWLDGHCEVDGAGRVVAVFGVCQDVTEQKAIEATLHAARQQAEAASQAKSAFLASMSHELRTPLNAIIGFSEMVVTEVLGPVGHERYRGYARDIHHSGRHLLELIDDVLDVSRIEAGKVELRREPVDLPRLIKEAVRLTRQARSEARHRYVVRVPAGVPPVQADRRAVKQVLINLLGNAAKFTPAGGRITVSVDFDDEAVRLTVADTGIGIPGDKLARLGQPFTQVDNVMTRRHGGSGMGLFITKSLVERHGGTLSIESRPDHGTSVQIRLPRT